MLKQLIFVKEKILLKFKFVYVKIMKQIIIAIVKILLQFFYSIGWKIATINMCLM